MSNYTESTITSSVPSQAEIRQRCRQRLDQACVEHHQLAARLQQQARACNVLANQLANLNQAGDHFRFGLSQLDTVVQNLQVNLRQLEHESSALATSMEQITKVGLNILQQAHADNQVLMANQQITQNELKMTEKEAEQISSRMISLTQELDQQMATANHFLNEMRQTQVAHNNSDANLEVGLEVIDQTGSNLQTVIREWENISKEAQHLSREANSKLQEVRALAALTYSSPSLFALLENLRDYRFEQVEVLPGGVEALLIDEKGRRVFISSQPAKHPEEALLGAIEVKIDLAGFDEADVTENCDLFLEYVFENDNLIIIRRATESPKRGPGDAAFQRGIHSVSRRQVVRE